MDRTLHYWPDDHTIQAETGQTWQAFVQQLAPYSQGLPLLYPSHWSLSDILGADWPSVTTGLAGRYPRDMVLGLSTLDTQGTLTKAGGRVMKNVSGYDLCRLMVGNHHSLGLITDVTLKLITYPNAFFGYWFTVSTHEEGLSLSQFLLAHHKPLLWAC